MQAGSVKNHRMTHNRENTPPPKASRTRKDMREDRLKLALKANMAKRKAQTRGRTAVGAQNADNNKDD